MRRGGLPRIVIYECSRALALSCSFIDMPGLRQIFRDMFDEACDAVTKLGLDLDNVMVERYLHCARLGENAFVVASPPLSNCDALTAAICSASVSASVDSIQIIEAKVTVTHESEEVPLKARHT